MQQFVRYVAGQATSQTGMTFVPDGIGRLTIWNVVSRICRRGHIAEQNSRLKNDERIHRRLPSIADDKELPSKFGHREWNGRSGCHTREVGLKSIFQGQIQNVVHLLMRFQCGFWHGCAGAQIPAFQCGSVKMATGAAGNMGR